MKALVVADNDTAIENISTVLKAAGYDTIVYRWLLKALDNIEEIAPHLIIISTKDYPRHWKTMTQFVQSGIGGHVPQVILYVPEDFSEEEEEKADALGVRGLFDSVGVEGLDTLRDILKKQDDIYAGTLNEKEETEESSEKEDESKSEVETQTDTEINSEDKFFEEPLATSVDSDEVAVPVADGLDNDVKESESVNRDDVFVTVETSDRVQHSEENNIEQHSTNQNKLPACSFIFTNPFNGAIVTGLARNYNGTTLVFTPDIISSASGVTEGTKITEASLKTGDSIEAVHAEVCKNQNTIMLISVGRC
jgi:hypothetical protein